MFNFRSIVDITNARSMDIPNNPGTISGLDCTADTRIVSLATRSSGLKIAMLADNGILSLTSAGGSSATLVARGSLCWYFLHWSSFATCSNDGRQCNAIRDSHGCEQRRKFGVAIAELPTVGSGVHGYVFTKSGSDWTLIGNGFGYYNCIAFSKDGSSVAAAYKASRMNRPGALQTFSNSKSTHQHHVLK
jgi:hypothetical protein